MEGINLPDDELRCVERKFGAKVRHMGAWNSDGVYGYLTIPITVVQRAAEALNTPSVMEAVSQLKQGSEIAQAKLFCELLDQYGSILIEEIVIAYRELLSPIVEWQLPERAVSAAH